MKTHYAYIRVSTVKQGEKGSSMQEQRTAIEVYAQRNGLTVGEWFEEMETAVGTKAAGRLPTRLKKATSFNSF